jgi:hypothetical protein
MNGSHDELMLHEQILLLALRDEEGTIAFGANYSFAVGGAVLAELLLHRRVEIEESKRRKLVNLIDAAPLGEPVMDECLEKIRNAKRRANPRTWVSRFASVKKLKHRIAEGLCDRGILRADDVKVLLFFTRKVYPEVNPAPERDMIERTRQAIFTESTEVDPRTVVLISLAKATDILRIPFDKKLLKQRKHRIQQLIDGEIMGRATREAVEAAQAAQAAVALCCTVPAVTAATVSS